MKPQVVPPDDSRKRLLGKHAVAPSASPSRNEGHGAGYLKVINRAGPSRSVTATVMSLSLRWRRRLKRESARGRSGSLSSSRKAGRDGSLNSTRSDMRSEEHTSELQSLMRLSYAVFCFHKKHTDNRSLSHLLNH